MLVRRHQNFRPRSFGFGGFVILLLLSSAVSGCGTSPAGGAYASSPAVIPSLPPWPIPHQKIQVPPGMLVHTVEPKETFWSIGKLYEVPYSEIMRINGMNDPSQLSVGTHLLVPDRFQYGRMISIPTIPTPSSSKWTHIVVHHTATATGNARILDRSHRKRGFRNGLGYHFLINNGSSGRKDGEIEIGPRWRSQTNGAHCNAGGMNQHGIGISLVGDFTKSSPSTAQLTSLVGLIERLREAYDIPLANIIRHQDVRGKVTACPGHLLPWTDLRRQIAAAANAYRQKRLSQKP